MAVPNPYEKLRENAILTAPKEELTLMLYDGALRFLNQSITAIDEKDFMKSSTFNIKVQDIIRELQFTLNMQIDISKSLAALYDYIYRLLVDANIEKNKEKLEEAKDLIKDLRETWKEAMTLARSGKK